MMHDMRDLQCLNAGITPGCYKRRSFEGARSFFSPVPTLLTWQIVSGMACSLIRIGSCLGHFQQVGTSHPTPVDGAACQRAKL